MNNPRHPDLCPCPICDFEDFYGSKPLEQEPSLDDKAEN